jgi:hypothetical protein
VATSQNGYSVLFDAGQTKVWSIPGTDRHFRLRPGDAGYVLACLALWWHRHIEPIDVGQWDDWGWAVRPVRGQTSGYSNHASGTAIDVNATRHPLGSAGTIAKMGLLRARVFGYCRGVVRAGAFYSGRKDEMHVEINKPMAAVSRLARRISRTPLGREVIAANGHYTSPVGLEPGTRTLRVGDRGEDVREVQKAVGAEVDGIYGPQTARLVKAWKRQQPHGRRLGGGRRFGRRAWQALGVRPNYG